MPNKSTLYLILLTILLSAYTIWDYCKKDRIGTIQQNFKAIPVKGIDEVDEIEISSASGKVSLSRTPEKGWKVIYPVADRADSKKIENIFTQSMIFPLKKLVQTLKIEKKVLIKIHFGPQKLV